VQNFTGIAEKLVRAKENISNLDAEIEAFFQKSDYPVLPQDDGQILLKAIEYHKNLVIPPRFAVLAGEAIHHLRSCFDHLVWHFTVNEVKNIRKLEFPVFEKEPDHHESRSLYKGKIEGIADTNALALIESLQPYKADDPLDNPLLIIHNFDIFDKHRELVIISAVGTVVYPIEMKETVQSYERANPELRAAEIARYFKGSTIAQPNVAFRNFGRLETKPVTIGLIELFNYTVNAIGKFEDI